MSDENQRQYELTLILSPNLQEEEIISLERDIESEIKKFKGVINKKSKAETRQLAYPIKKVQSGYFLVLDFSFEPGKIEEFSSILKHKKDILRHLINISAEEETKETLKKVDISKKPSEEEGKIKDEKEKKVELEEIDKKLDEILGA